MKRPSFQFYPEDWLSNSNLRRCSHEEKGIWIDIICLLHDQEEYGVVRWPLAEISQAVGCSIGKLRNLVNKGVLKGCDASGEVESLIYVPRSGRKDGPPVTLIEQQKGPLWYSSRMVIDEYKKLVRGEQNTAPKPAPNPHIGECIDATPNATPSTGERGRSQRAAPPSPSPTPLSSEGTPSGGEPPKMTDPDDIIFGYGVPLLTNAGTADKQARSFLGGLRKAHGDNALIDKLRECLKAKPLQPLEWLAAALPPGAVTGAKRKPAPENFATKDYGTGGRL